MSALLPFLLIVAAVLACLAAGVLIARLCGFNGPDVECSGLVFIDDDGVTEYDVDLEPFRPLSDAWPCVHRMPCPIHNPDRFTEDL